MNINKMLKQAQKMQADAAKMQSELAERTVTASVGGGKVTVVASGAGDVLSIKISKDVVDPEDVEMLEDLVLSGVRQAIEDGKKMAESEMGKLTAGLSGMGLPGLGL
jgi:DNA-binding YbaB/EbfC family protein